VRAVNDTWDNDTVAAIVGAIVGARHGRKALPQGWIDGLLGRTGEADDGRVFQLIAETERFLRDEAGHQPAVPDGAGPRARP
jgi:ADP-ribosyl-[dinitrogen reductase] hydrolase